MNCITMIDNITMLSIYETLHLRLSFSSITCMTMRSVPLRFVLVERDTPLYR